MKKTFAIIAFTVVSFLGCKKSETVTVTEDANLPSGSFTVQRKGTLVAQNGTPTAGTVELGADAQSVNYFHLGKDFKTELGTGTTSIYLSTSATYKADPANGNPDLFLIGIVKANGESYFKLTSAIPSKFTHVIIWCGSAGIPFGNAPIQ